MVDTGLTISVVALAISFIALFLTLCQLLAQVFDTAEGYRRCQPSVLGRWATKTRKQWRWTQFRFETFFSTPELVLGPYVPTKYYKGNGTPHGSMHKAKAGNSILPQSRVGAELTESYQLSGSSDASEDVSINGDDYSLELTLVPTPKPGQKARTSELVCWNPFLESIHKNSRLILQRVENIHQFESHQRETSWPTVRFKERSWDFMPPDVVRPFASSTVSDIVIIARRMGMSWKDFRPNEGVMEAEGAFHGLSATIVRGIGIMLQYRQMSGDLSSSYSKRKLFGHSEHMAPKTCVCTTEADRMWFGILPGNADLQLPDFEIGNIEDVYKTLYMADATRQAGDTLKKIQENNFGFLHGFCDIIPMVAPWMRQPGSTINQVPRPCSYTTGLTWYQVAYEVFYKNLKEYNETRATTQTEWVSAQYEFLRGKHGIEWDGISPDLNNRRIEFFDDLESLYHATTDYFKALQKSEDTEEERAQNFYLDLLCAHLKEAPRSFIDATQHSKRREQDYKGDRPWRGEAMHFYWDYMPDYVRSMAAKGWTNAQLVQEAWITLIFRAFLWQRAHVGVENSPPLPSQYYGSQLPVYIG